MGKNSIKKDFIKKTFLSVSFPFGENDLEKKFSLKPNFSSTFLSF